VTYWRIQHAADPTSHDHRSQIGLDEDDLGHEAGTSCCESFTALQAWARGRHADWIDADMCIVELEGDLVGRGADGECIVRPTRELQRIYFRSTREALTSAVVQTLTVSGRSGS